ncbi:hypothetical protein [Candidatus Cyanaurora vandensis]|uniref:hypothetical protein n=1 Tax=Candidatus Cyanaurora vandensis TaxID=2714958 RepID=UPI00257D67B3|nr:hypothetical protein [Candidatus Cyanaurora vandensis]
MQLNFRSLGYLSCLTLACVSLSPASAERPEARPELVKLAKHDTSRTLREMGPIPLIFNKFTEIPNPPRPRKVIKKEDLRATQVPDSVVQNAPGEPLDLPLTASFDGVNSVNFVLPPDPTGEVGPNHYFQWVNLSFAIYNKTGTLLYGPASGNTLWNGFGGPCQSTNSGDPIVMYDHLADRWVVTQFGIPNFSGGPYYQCIAVSTGADPTGSYHRYAFVASNNNLNDYPKLGVWPDGYYMTVNQFLNGFSFAGAGVFAFEREKMLLGQAAKLVYVNLQPINPNFGGMLPSDLDGPVPAAGTPAYFMEADDSNFGFPTDQIALWEFKVNWNNIALSTFGLSGQPNQLFKPPALAPFDMNLCPGTRNCIPQLGTTCKIDTIGDRLMYRLQYRNMGTHQVMVANHSVDVNGRDLAGIRWYEFRKTTGDWSIYQQGTYSPTTTLNRWMASIAMDGAGNIGMGYSTSSADTYPSIYATGRLATDPLGTMRLEQLLFAGRGSQTSSSSRWGDYSHLSIDPVDNCTFWHTSEYYSSTSSANWRTRISAVKIPGCVVNTPVPATP